MLQPPKGIVAEKKSMDEEIFQNVVNEAMEENGMKKVVKGRQLSNLSTISEAENAVEQYRRQVRQEKRDTPLRAKKIKKAVHNVDNENEYSSGAITPEVNQVHNITDTGPTNQQWDEPGFIKPCPIDGLSCPQGTKTK